MKKVLCVGATGRIGSALARSLIIHTRDVEVIIAGRNQQLGESIAAQLGPRATFRKVDLNDGISLRDAMADVDCVFTSAGPFQLGQHQVLDAAIDLGIDYMDVGDDVEYGREAKQRHEAAIAKGVCGITNGGIYPGYSNVMAGELIERTGGALKTDFSYFASGTGGAGPTILAATFLLVGLPATEIINNEVVSRRGYSGKRNVRFLDPVGTKAIFGFDLPETHSIHEIYKVPNISARFGTAPMVSNYATYLTGLLAPKSLLSNKDKVRNYVEMILGMIEFLDRFVNFETSMRVDVTGTDGVNRTMHFYHQDLLESAGAIMAQQVIELIQGNIKQGIWWTEQAITNKLEFLKKGAAICGAKFEVIDPAPVSKREFSMSGSNRI